MSRPYARSKYGNKRVKLDGITFDSKAEAARYSQLKLLERAGTISDLKVHTRWRIDVNGRHVTTYIDDFSYRDSGGELVVEDVKGHKTGVYKLKRALMSAVHGVEIREIQA